MRADDTVGDFHGVFFLRDDIYMGNGITACIGKGYCIGLRTALEGESRALCIASLRVGYPCFLFFLFFFSAAFEALV